jgi:hypothetical protein
MVACETDILSHSTRKMDRWVPLDQYSLRYRENELANILDAFKMIRKGIIAGMHFETKTRLTTIKAAHQIVNGATSQWKKGACGCKR